MKSGNWASILVNGRMFHPQVLHKFICHEQNSLFPTRGVVLLRIKLVSRVFRRFRVLDSGPTMSEVR